MSRFARSSPDAPAWMASRMACMAAHPRWTPPSGFHPPRPRQGSDASRPCSLAPLSSRHSSRREPQDQLRSPHGRRAHVYSSVSAATAKGRGPVLPPVRRRGLHQEALDAAASATTEECRRPRSGRPRPSAAPPTPRPRPTRPGRQPRPRCAEVRRGAVEAPRGHRGTPRPPPVRTEARAPDWDNVGHEIATVLRTAHEQSGDCATAAAKRPRLRSKAEADAQATREAADQDAPSPSEALAGARERKERSAWWPTPRSRSARCWRRRRSGPRRRPRRPSPSSPRRSRSSCAAATARPPALADVRAKVDGTLDTAGGSRRRPAPRTGRPPTSPDGPRWAVTHGSSVR